MSHEEDRHNCGILIVMKKWYNDNFDRQRKNIIIVLVLIFLWTLLIQLYPFFDNRFCHTLLSIMYMALFLAWNESINSRIISPVLHRCLNAIAILSMIWIMLRTVKYYFIPYENVFSRYLWYLYYIPIILIPLMAVFVAYNLDRHRNKFLGKIRLLYLPASVLIGLVMTNDLHHLVFSFPFGSGNTIANYSHQFFYWIIVAWVIICIISSLISIIYHQQRSLNSKLFWLPISLMIIGVTYGIFYIFYPQKISLFSSDITIIYALINMFIWESCILYGLIPSNKYYKELLLETSLAVQIVDENYKVCYSSQKARPLNQAIMKQAENGPVDLDVHTRLSSAPIYGGHVLWCDDVTAVNETLAQLQFSAAVVKQRNEIIQAETNLKSRQIRVDEQSHLYDQIGAAILPQIRMVRRLLSIMNEDNEKQVLTKICVLGAYIKRRSNLLLICKGKESIQATELELCFKESVENIRLGSTKVAYFHRAYGNISVQHAELIYDFFECLAENTSGIIDNLLLEYHAFRGSIALTWQCHGIKKLNYKRYSDMLQAQGGIMKMTEPAGEIRLEVSLPVEKEL